MSKRRIKGKPLSEDSTDTMDGIDWEICFLREIVQLLYVASLHNEARENISFTHISADMLQRLDQVKKLSDQLFECCGKP